MNWVGGNLSRLSKGANKDLKQRQRIHFAKSRKRLQESTSVTSELDTLHLSPDVDAVIPLVCAMSHNDSLPRILKTPLPTTNFHATLHETDTRLSSSGKQRPADLSDFENQNQHYKRPRKRSPTDNLRHRLLISTDWLGLELAKPLQLNVRRAGRPVKRRRFHARHDMEVQSSSDLALPCHDASIVSGLQSKEPVLEAGSDDTRIRIGSRALKKWPSSSSAFGSPIMLRHNTQTDHQPECRGESEHYTSKYGETERGLETSPEHGNCMDKLGHYLTNAEICNANRKFSLWADEDGGASTTILQSAPTSMNVCDSPVSRYHVAYPLFVGGDELYNEGPYDSVTRSPPYHSSNFNEFKHNAVPAGMPPGIYHGKEKEIEDKHHWNLTESRDDAQIVDQKWRQFLGLRASTSPESNTSGGRDEKLSIDRGMTHYSLPNKDHHFRFRESIDTDSTPYSDWSNVNRTLIASSELGSVSKNYEEIVAGRHLRRQGRIQSEERTDELWKRSVFEPGHPETP